jgi:superfamily II DNA helicase RecQ
MGLTATAVNSDVYSPQLHKVSVARDRGTNDPTRVIAQEIESRQHRVILTSPEMCIEHQKFSKLLRTPEFTKHILAIVIDEVHCVSQWGDKFRKTFNELGRLRSYVPVSVPFLATSVTLPPHILGEIELKLCFSPARTLLVNLGNDRLNITPMVCHMRGTSSDLAALDFSVDEARAGAPLVRTFIFFNTRDLTQKAFNHLLGLVPVQLQPQIGFLHAGQTKRARAKVMMDFDEGRIDILCATEAVAMIC